MLVDGPLVGGPFDFGGVAVRVAVYVDPVTAQAHAVSDPLPMAVNGVQLDVRDIHVDLDRPGFAINPTDCRERSVTGTVTRADGSGVAVANRFQVGSCADLGFRPAVRARLSGAVGRNGHPKISVEIVPRGGDANISSAALALPAGELLDTNRIHALCARSLAPQECPRGSYLGRVRLKTPVLDAPLEGPIYLRRPTGQFPDLLADLRSGQFHVLMHGYTAARAGRLRIEFPAIPDVPVSRALITLSGGQWGVVVNSETLCDHLRMGAAAFTAHSGRTLRLRPRVRVEGRC
jgi:hypothetical protein